MAVTQQQLAILATKLSGFTDQEKSTLAAASTQDLSMATAQLITGQRAQGISQVIGALVSGGSVSSWASLHAAATVADGATITAAMEAFTASLEAEDAAGLIANAVWVALAAKKHHGV